MVSENISCEDVQAQYKVHGLDSAALERDVLQSFRISSRLMFIHCTTFIFLKVHIALALYILNKILSK